MKPIVKYRGGKWTEIKHFESYIPAQYDTYIEPFFGGGALFFYLEPEKAIINDVNARLIQFYRTLRDQYPEMRKQLDQLQALYETQQAEYEQLKAAAQADAYVENKNEALYYLFRQYFNYPVDEWLDAVVYFFINKTAYSGMIRYNRNGEYNVPFGRYKHFNTQLITDQHHGLLQRAEIFNTDFASIFEKSSKDDFMFLDPPYDTIFNDYGNLDAADGFNEEEHRRLAEAYKQLECKAMMVIGKTDLTYELYKDYIVDEYDKTYAVNIRNRFKSAVKHIIVCNY